MLDVKTATTEELEQFVRHDFETRIDESDTDLLLEVVNELARRDEEADPLRAEISETRGMAWFALASGQITQEEYRYIILLTAQTVEEMRELDQVIIPRRIAKAVACRELRQEQPE